MTSTILSRVFTAVLVCLSSFAQAGAESLFDGKTLSGWVPMHGGTWEVENGVIIGHHGTNWTTNPEKSGSWLRSEKEYGDFVLELEYAINAKGNSGIFVHSALEKNPAFTGHEIQILDDFGREPKKTTTGSLYDVVAPTKNQSRPAGEWNQVRIECRAQRIIVTLNGEQIVDYTSDRRTRGYIGLQNHDHHAVVKFRNIKMEVKS